MAEDFVSLRREVESMRTALWQETVTLRRATRHELDGLHREMLRTGTGQHCLKTPPISSSSEMSIRYSGNL